MTYIKQVYHVCMGQNQSRKDGSMKGFFSASYSLKEILLSSTSKMNIKWANLERVMSNDPLFHA